MNILGISGFYHDSAACLVRDGQIVAAASEERFSRVKHDPRFPVSAIRYCLEQARVGPEELDHVAFYEKPLLKFDRLLDTYLCYAPRGFRSFLAGVPHWLRQKLHLPREMDKGLGGRYTGRYIFIEHHESHAASAFFPSPFNEAAILTLDGVGEWATATLGVGRGNKIELTHEQRFPHSLGLLYSSFTYFTGFRVNSGEYKLMGLAPYGNPIYKDLILDRLVDLKDDGSMRMDLSYFSYGHGSTMTGPKMNKLFGGPPREPGSEITQREMDIAASIQLVTEEVVLGCARHARRQTGMNKLVMAGGVALNCVANGKILREGIFDDIWVQPAAGDAGGALGAALFTSHQLLDRPREADDSRDAQSGSLLGPRFTNEQVKTFLNEVRAKSHFHETEGSLLDAIVRHLTTEKVVGFFQGRMEFGPRGLGARSILADPRSPDMQSVLNRKIKFRESFRPFAPSVLEEDVHEWFDMKPGQQTPYMLFVAGVRHDKRLTEGPRDSDPTGLEKIHQERSVIPGVTHVDGSARVQTVDPHRHGRYYRLIKKFKEVTGCPILINTSFNIRGEPIVCRPRDAYRCFMATDMDVLVIEDFILLKHEQPQPERQEIEEHIARFGSD